MKVRDLQRFMAKLPQVYDPHADYLESLDPSEDLDLWHARTKAVGVLYDLYMMIGSEPEKEREILSVLKFTCDLVVKASDGLEVLKELDSMIDAPLNYLISVRIKVLRGSVMYEASNSMDGANFLVDGLAEINSYLADKFKFLVPYEKLFLKFQKPGT